MGNISIVTAFFDIGRGDWTPEKGLPHYLQRSTDTYVERFGHLATLNNELIIFTSEELVDKIKEKCVNRSSPTHILAIDFKNSFGDQRELITKIQKDPNFIKMINPYQVKNPEYWCADYVLVNYLKSYFVEYAISQGVATQDLVAWMDFGYCRDVSTLNGKEEWSFNFEENKIHFFDYKDYNGQPIQNIIANNDVHILGAKVVAGKNMWPKLRELISGAFKNLTDANLIDDDQTMMLLASLYQPEIFVKHRIIESAPFVMFKEYCE
jgi:protein YibB